MAQFTSVESMILNALAIIIIVIFCGSIYAFIRSILLFIFSHGDPESKKKAWNWIRFMIIGVIMTVILLFFFPLLFKYMGVQGSENFNAKNIFNRVSVIFSRIINIKSEVSELNNVGGESTDGNGYQDTSTPPNIDGSNYEL